MLKMVRKNVLVDLGPPTNLLGAKLIELPDKYKRINSEGHILGFGPQCRKIGSGSIGKKCVIGINHNPETKLNPQLSKTFGLEPHWHFMVHEDLIEVLITE